jgi:hypothetical protein
LRTNDYPQTGTKHNTAAEKDALPPRVFHKTKRGSRLVKAQVAAALAFERRVVGDLGQVSAPKAPDHPRVVFPGPVYPAPPQVLADGLFVPEPFSASGALSHFQVPFIPK